MRLGIFGGTFDPIHWGHLILAETCREELGLDEVWFMPAALNPHKQGRSISSAKDRLEMVRFAIAGNPHFRVSNLEIKRQGPSYTVDTLRTIREGRLDEDFFLMIGQDSVADFPRWKEPDEILRLATLAVVNRGRERPDLDAFAKQLGEEALDRVVEVEMPAIDISATDIRRRAQEGRSLRYRMPRSVELYLLQNQLYTSENPAEDSEG
ncbi:MAG: nicotinate-nucleotide adenylyltransferase [Planctomycetaceae bacterium]|nr:nicotinate-nucleotide adenylyltransferase [Planctomycetaceae bacterium]